jgi:hypothetical protein
MINPKLGSCKDCATIPHLLNEIDCKFTSIGKDMYNNIIYMLNRNIPFDTGIDLLHYKRILEYKFCNPEYAQNYSVDKIASKVKLLIRK